MANKEQIGEWFDRGVAEGAAFMLVAVDTFSWEDYPVFAANGDEARKRHAELDEKNMQRVLEVYDLAGDKEHQLDTPRVNQLSTIREAGTGDWPTITSG